jgi:MFS family permease
MEAGHTAREGVVCTEVRSGPWRTIDVSLQSKAGTVFEMRRIHSPVLLGNLEDARARAFVVLFTCDAIARSILISIVPLQAYALLGAAQLVSVLYFSVAIVGLAASLTVPVVLHRLRRRWVLTIGAGVQVLSALLLALATKPALIAGLALQMLGMAILEIVINLYLLDHIPRRRLSHFEPRRLLFAGSAFAAGPWIGVYLHRNVAENLTYLVAALATLTLTTRACGRRRRRHRARCVSCSALPPSRAWSSPGCWRSAATAGGSCTLFTRRSTWPMPAIGPRPAARWSRWDWRRCCWCACGGASGRGSESAT